MEQIQPIEIGALLRQVPGKWVAIKDGALVDVQETPYKLFESLRSRGIKDATVIRAPAEDEAQLVGLG